jgi:hypothetical protein
MLGSVWQAPRMLMRMQPSNRKAANQQKPRVTPPIKIMSIASMFAKTGRSMKNFEIMVASTSAWVQPASRLLRSALPD